MLKESTESGSPRSPSPERLRAPRPPRLLGLRARIALSVGSSVALVIAALTLVGITIATRRLEADLRETARVTGVAIADEIELGQEATDAAGTLTSMLRDFLNAAADLRSISVYRADGDTARLVVSTSAPARVPVDLIRRVVASRVPARATIGLQSEAIVVPVYRRDVVTGAVAVEVSLASAQRVVQAGLIVAVVGAACAVIAITLLVHLLIRRLVLEPVDDFRAVVAAAGAGDLAARAAHTGDDELGELGEGLNRTLSELQDLHRSLSERVAEATREIRERNAQIVRSYESVFELREVTARNQQLAAAGQTLAIVAHQIGTPLNLASGHLQLLQHESGGSAQAPRLAIVAEQLERVSSIVHDLLHRVRPKPMTRVVDIGEVLHRLVDASHVRLAAAHVRLDTRVEERLPGVLADETRLELAMLNLITNALDAMPGGGCLTLTARATRAWVTIEVIDTGPGISDDVLPRIFDPWVTTKPHGQGTGLGLTITRDAIIAAGGSIRVASASGRGTAFTIELPGVDRSVMAS